MEQVNYHTTSVIINKRHKKLGTHWHQNTISKFISFCLLSADHLLLIMLQRELEEIWRDVGVAATAQAQD